MKKKKTVSPGITHLEFRTIHNYSSPIGRREYRLQRLYSYHNINIIIIIIMPQRALYTFVQPHFRRRQSRVRRRPKVDYVRPTADEIKKSLETSFVSKT